MLWCLEIIFFSWLQHYRQPDCFDSINAITGFGSTINHLSSNPTNCTLSIYVSKFDSCNKIRTASKMFTSSFYHSIYTLQQFARRECPLQSYYPSYSSYLVYPSSPHYLWHQEHCRSDCEHSHLLLWCLLAESQVWLVYFGGIFWQPWWAGR